MMELCRSFPRTKAACPQAICLMVLLCVMTPPATQKASFVRGDDSDWWSNVADAQIDFDAPQTHTQHRELGSTLEIATIIVGSGEIDRATTRLGKTRVVFRGDGSLGRIQACYVSADSTTHLIFQENGQDFGAAFYLFKDGQDWNGSKLCAKSPLVSQDTRTESGLRLGLTRTEVESILGKPSIASPDRLRYNLEVVKRTSADKLKQLRAQSPDLSDKDFREAYDSYYVTFTVVAEFEHSILTYLAVARYESYP